MKPLLLLSLFVVGCGVFQQVHKTKDEEQLALRKESKLNFSSATDKVEHAKELIFYKDSNAYAYWIQVWPKGSFSFSPEKGFVGEAEKIVIAGKGRQMLNASSVKLTDRQEKTKADLEVQTDEKLKASKKVEIKDSSLSWKWIAVMVLATIIGIILIYNRLRR